MRIIAMGVFATTGCSAFNIATRLITGYSESHVGLLFRRESLAEEYWEMQFSNGLVGPRDISRLYDWAKGKWNRRVKCLWLPLSGDAAYQKHLEVQRLKAGGIKGYAKAQLLAQFGHERWGWHVADDSTHMTCSELCSRICRPEYDVRTEDHPNDDSVSPGFLWAGLNALVSANSQT